MHNSLKKGNTKRFFDKELFAHRLLCLGEKAAAEWEVLLSALREVCAHLPSESLYFYCIVYLCTSYMCELCCTVPLNLGLGLWARLMSVCILYLDIV